MSQDQLTPGRMEAFSDGVIAVIITIMVLELHVPGKEVSNAKGIAGLLPLIFVYLLSFVQIGIYWVNHHYLVDDVEYVTHGILWSNLIFLFTLSFIPFATNWVGERGLSSFSMALYAVCCALPAVSWFVLSTTICHNSGVPLASSPLKVVLSTSLYLGAIPMAYLSPYAAIAMISIVAVVWLIPPKRVVEQTRLASKNHTAESR